MSYLATPAASGSTLSGTRDQIRNNFTKIETDFAVNHIGFDLTDEGKHKFLQLPEQASAPTTAANEAGLFAQEKQSVAQLSLRRESDGAELQLSASDATDTTAQSATGYTCLPGGLIMQWGTKSVGATTNATVTFTKAYSQAADVYSITTTMKSTSTSSEANGNVETITATNFKIYNTSSVTRTYYWLAIGKAA